VSPRSQVTLKNSDGLFSFCRAEVLTVKTNINVLVTVGLGERGFADYRIVRDTCRMLLKLVPENDGVPSTDEPYRLVLLHYYSLTQLTWHQSNR